MSTRYLRAEEVARLAGVAKSTVLAAIKRGEVRSSRTLGRGTRIPIESAREYLRTRGKTIPHELRDARASLIAVVSESRTLAERVRAATEPEWTVHATLLPYAMLLWVGLHAPTCVVVDLDLATLNPFTIVRALASRRHRAPTHVIAIGANPEMLSAARTLGATHGVLGHDAHGIARAFATA